MKTWDTNALNQLDSGSGAIRVLITTEISATTYRFIDEPVESLTLGGNVFTGLGDGVEFSGVPSQGGMEAGRFSFTIPSTALVLDADATDPIPILSSIYDEDYKNREIDVEYAVFTSAPGEYVGSIAALSGRIAAAPLTINPGEGVATLTLDCQTLGQDFRRTNGGTFGSAHVRRYYSSDEFGDFVVDAVTDKAVRWGVGGDANTSTGTTGSTAVGGLTSPGELSLY